MNLWKAVLAAAAGLVAFVAWANRSAAKARFRVTPTDVEIALAELLDPHALDHDAWDRFLARPIDDPDLESIRLTCLKIRQEYPSTGGKDISEEGEQRVAALLDELRHRMNPDSPTADAH